MKVEGLRVEFTNSPNLLFFPGQPVIGNVKFRVLENIEIKGKRKFGQDQCEFRFIAVSRF